MKIDIEESGEVYVVIAEDAGRVDRYTVRGLAIALQQIDYLVEQRFSRERPEPDAIDEALRGAKHYPR